MEAAQEYFYSAPLQLGIEPSTIWIGMEHPMDVGALLFWGFVTLASVSIVWAHHLSRREAERTIRMALERGLLLDANAIRELRFGSNQRTPAYLAIGGLILLSVALALTVFAFVIAPEEPDTLLPLLGIAAFIAIPALTTSVIGLWLMCRRPKAPISLSD